MRRLVSSAFCAAAGTATSAAPAIIMATKVFVIFGVPLLRLKPDAPCARPDCKEKSCHSGMIERHRRLSPRRHPPILVPCRSEEHTSELQSLMRISYAAFCLKNNTKPTHHHPCLDRKNTL